MKNDSGFVKVRTTSDDEYIERNFPENDELSRKNSIERQRLHKHDDLTQESPKSSESKVPAPDGGWGWMVVLGSFFTFFIASGMVYSFGIFYIEFLEVFKAGKAETAWVGSLTMGIMLLVGPIAGTVIDKWGCRMTSFIGASIAATGFILSIFSPNLHYLYFSFGITSGLGFGLIYLPSIVCVSKYFERRRSLAIGISMSGSGIGIFVFSPILKYLIDEYGWRGALLIDAGFILNCAVCGALFQPLKATKSPRSLKENSNSQSQIAEDMEYLNIKSIASYNCKESPNNQTPLVTGKNAYISSQEIQIKEDESDDCILRQDCNVMEDICKLPDAISEADDTIFCFGYPRSAFNVAKRIFDFSLLKNYVFLIYVISNAFTSLTIDTPQIFLPDRASDAGMTLETSKWLLSALGISSTVSKILAGYISDCKGVNRLCFYISILIGMGVTTALCPLCNTYLLLMFFSCAMGLFVGAYMSLTSIVVIDLVGEEMMSKGFGIYLMFKGIAVLVGPPLSGWFNDITGNYDISFIMSGVILALSGLILLPIFVMQTKLQSKNKSEQ